MSQVKRIISAALVCSAAGFGLSGCGGSSDNEVVKEVPTPLSYAQYCQLPAAQINAPVLPEPTGRVCLGKASYQVIDAARTQTNADGNIGPRELSLKVWYPVESVGGGKRADYWNSKISAHVKALFNKDLSNAPDMQTHTKDGGKPLATSAYPVVLLSPGYSDVAENYSALAEDLASRGVVVVGVDSPYISGPTWLSNGQVALSTELPETQTEAEEKAASAAISAILAADLRSALDWLQLPGRIGISLDLSRVGVLGHSIGGAAAWLSSSSDARVLAAINMDGDVPEASKGIFPKPILYLSADTEQELSIRTALEGATSAKRYVAIPETLHMDFGDLKLLVNSYAPNTTATEMKAMDLGAGSTSNILKIIRSEVWDFFRQHLRM